MAAGWPAASRWPRALVADGVNRALLLTDGLANHGITDADELAHHATELRARGVSTSTFGVGNDFDEALLQGMAQAGGGHFYDIASATAIRDHISSEVGDTLEVVARDAALQVTLPEGVRIESLGAFPAREVGGRTRVELGDLVSGQEVEVPLRLSFPLGRVGGTLHAVLGLVDRDDTLADATGRLAWEYADDPANDTQPRDRDVDRVIARVFVARARREAVRLNRVGDYDGARTVLEATARRIKGYAGRDPELRRDRRRPPGRGGHVPPRDAGAQPQGGLRAECLRDAVARPGRPCPQVGKLTSAGSRAGRSVACRRPAHEADEVALRVADEGVPLVGAGGAQGVVRVTEDDVRFGDHLRELPDTLQGRAHVVHGQVQHRG